MAINITDPIELFIQGELLELIQKFYNKDYGDKLYPYPGISKLTIQIDKQSLELEDFDYSLIDINIPTTIEVEIERIQINKRYLEAIRNAKYLKQIRTRLNPSQQMFYIFNIDRNTTIEDVISKMETREDLDLSTMPVECRLVISSGEEVPSIYL